MARPINVDEIYFVNLSVSVDHITVEFNDTKMDAKRQESQFQTLLLTTQRIYFPVK